MQIDMAEVYPDGVLKPKWNKSPFDWDFNEGERKKAESVLYKYNLGCCILHFVQAMKDNHSAKGESQQ